MNGNRSTVTTYSPLAVLTLTLGTVWLILAALMWLSYRLHRTEHLAAERRSRLAELHGAIIHMDKVLTQQGGEEIEAVCEQISCSTSD